MPRSRLRPLSLGALALGALAAGASSSLGCGPVEYMNQVSSRAATALMLAQREGAAQYAPYEYTKASEYYHKAREEAGHSSYQVAIEYGRRCEELATKARGLARDRASQQAQPGSPAPPAAPPAPPAAPPAPAVASPKAGVPKPPAPGATNK